MQSNIRWLGDPETGQAWIVIREWRQDKAEDVEACTSYEVLRGPKRYARQWDGLDYLEWGWVVHPSARLVWEA